MALPRSASSLRALTRSLNLSKTFSPAIASRPFTSSPILSKKRKVAVPHSEPEQSSPPSGRHERSKQVTGGKQKSGKGQKEAPATVEEFDPLDFTALHEAIAPIDAHFKSQLQTLLHGGRFNPDVLGSLQVPLKDANSGETTTFPLKELAQIVPRGRTHVSLLLNDAAYTKPILSAVQSSPEFNQQPQKSEDNELELVMRVEMERKEEVVKRVKEVGQQWRERVRGARGKFEKSLKDKAKKGVVLPDDLKRAEKEVQRVQDGKMREVEEEEKRAVKALQK